MIAARPDFKRPGGSSSTKSYLEPVSITEKGLLPADFVLEDLDSHFIYVCKKMDDTVLSKIPTYPLTAEILYRTSNFEVLRVAFFSALQASKLHFNC